MEENSQSKVIKFVAKILCALCGNILKSASISVNLCLILLCLLSFIVAIPSCYPVKDIRVNLPAATGVSLASGSLSSWRLCAFVVKTVRVLYS